MCLAEGQGQLPEEQDQLEKNSQPNASEPAEQAPQANSDAQAALEIETACTALEQPQTEAFEPEPEQPQGPGILERLGAWWACLFASSYDFCYYVGIQLLRRTRSSRRWLVHTAEQTAKNAVHKIQKEWRSFRVGLRIMRRGLFEPMHNLRERHRELLQEAADARRRKQRVFTTYFQVFWHLVRIVSRAFGFIFSYVAPVAAIAFLVVVIRQYTHQPLALRLEYNGEELGYISDEWVFTQAQNEVKTRIISEASVTPENIVPSFELTVVDQQELLTVDDLTNILIQLSGSDLQEAYGLYIQGRFVGAVEDGDGLVSYLDELLEQYTSPDAVDETVQFIKRVRVTPLSLYPISSVKPLEEVLEQISREERGERRYTVISGDTPIRIAQKNGLTFSELKALNPNVDVSLLPGDELLISQSVPYLGVKVSRRVIVEEEIPYQIKQETNPDHDVGWTVTTQSGETGLRQVVYDVTMVDGLETERREISRDVIKQPVEQIIQVGGNRPLQFIPSSSNGTVPKGTFGWPTSGGSITTGFLGYYGHTGSDITWPGCYGGPIYASMDGVVTVAKTTYWGYGIHCYIDHGGGVQTLYAHMSQMYVQPGQQVKQGELIGLIGRTGNATGPHLHFEIRMNGTPVDAAPYLYG